MKTRQPYRTVRAHIPVATFAKIAFYAAGSGLTIGQFVQAALIDSVARSRPALLDGVGVPSDGEVQVDMSMPGDDNSGDAGQTSDLSIEDLL